MRIRSRRETGENKRQTAAISDLVRACESLVAALAEQNAASNRRKQEAGDGESVQDIAQTQQDANSRSSQEGAVQNSPITRLLGHGGDVLAGLTLLGLACYATTWFAYSRFYGDLGIRPAEIGITYAYIVPRAAVGLTLLVIAAVAVILPVVLSANLDPPQSSSWSATVLISLGPIVFATWLFDRYEGDVSDAVGLSFLWLGIIIGFANLGPLLFMVREHQRRIPIVAPLLLLVSGIGVVILEWLVRAHGQSTFAKGSLILLGVPAW